MSLFSSKEFKRLKNKIENLSNEAKGWDGSILKAASSAISCTITQKEIDRASNSGDISMKEAKKLKNALAKKAKSMGVHLNS